MKTLLWARVGGNWKAVVFLLLISPLAALATDWPQYRGPTTDGVSLEPIATNWPAGGPTVVWRNTSLTNGFSSFAVSQGRAFTQISRDDGSGLHEYCVAVDAATGVEQWATLIDSAAWPLGVVSGQNGSSGIDP